MDTLEIMRAPECLQCGQKMSFVDVDVIDFEGYINARWICEPCQYKLTDIIHNREDGFHFSRKVEFDIYQMPSDLYASNEEMTGVIKYKANEQEQRTNQTAASRSDDQSDESKYRGGYNCKNSQTK